MTSVTTLVTDWSSKFWWLARDQPATFKSVITRSRGQHCKPIDPSCCNSLRESGTDFRHTAALCPLASPNRLRAPWPPRKLLSFHPLRCKTSMANPMMSHSVQELTILSYWPRPAWGGNRWLPSQTRRHAFNLRAAIYMPSLGADCNPQTTRKQLPALIKRMRLRSARPMAIGLGRSTSLQPLAS